MNDESKEPATENSSDTAGKQPDNFLSLSPNSRFRRLTLLQRAAAALGRKAEKAGSILGKGYGKKFLEDKRTRAENFDISTHGEENLQGLDGRPFIVAANHTRHEGIYGNLITPPDSFVLENVINKNVPNPVQTVVMQDSDFSLLQNKVVVGLEKGFFEKQDNIIPVKRDKTKVNLEFVRRVGQAVAEGKPILIFPEGNWYNDWDPEHPLEAGVALIAQKYGLPIVPAYVKGARNWKPHTKVDVAFGKPIETSGGNREEIMDQIRQRITRLQQSITNRS